MLRQNQPAPKLPALTAYSYPPGYEDVEPVDSEALQAKIAAALPELPVVWPENAVIDYKADLNDAQLRASSCINGPLLIIAGAGTGKTRTLVYRTAFMLESGIAPDKILLVTFTRKAAREMTDRIQSLLPAGRGKRIQSGTFHSLANMLLRRFAPIVGLQPNFSIIDTVDSEDVLNMLKGKMGLAKKEKPFPKKRTLQAVISRSRNCDESIEEILIKDYKGALDYAPEIERLKEAYFEYKSEKNVMDYDDLLEQFKLAMEMSIHFRTRVQSLYSHIMVDEYQDTNIVQRDILRLMTGDAQNLMVVGDDSQSIYSFRGAHFENILTFPDEYENCRIVKIEENYRSQPAVLDFCNCIVESCEFGYRKQLFSTVHERRGMPEYHSFFGPEDEAAFVADTMLALREEGLKYKEMAALYRSGFHGNMLQGELMRRGIPFVVYGGIRFAERRHVKDIMAILRICHNPVDMPAWDRILLLVPGIGAVRAAGITDVIFENSGVLNPDAIRQASYTPTLKALSQTLEALKKENISIPGQIALALKFYTPLLKQIESDYKERLQDIRVLEALAAKYNSLEGFLSDFALDPPSNMMQNEVAPVDAEDEDVVVISTVHSAKGLEWAAVFVIHLLDGLFPSDRSVKSVRELDEERRLFYVACTRAKEYLFLSSPGMVGGYAGWFSQPSRFLAEINTPLFSVKGAGAKPQLGYTPKKLVSAGDSEGNEVAESGDSIE